MDEPFDQDEPELLEQPETEDELKAHFLKWHLVGPHKAAEPYLTKKHATLKQHALLHSYKIVGISHMHYHFLPSQFEKFRSEVLK